MDRPTCTRRSSYLPPGTILNCTAFAKFSPPLIFDLKCTLKFKFELAFNRFVCQAFANCNSRGGRCSKQVTAARPALQLPFSSTQLNDTTLQRERTGEHFLVPPGFGRSKGPASSCDSTVPSPDDCANAAASAAAFNSSSRARF